MPVTMLGLSRKPCKTVPSSDNSQSTRAERNLETEKLGNIVVCLY